MNIPKDCPYTEEEIREGFNTMKKNLKNYYKSCSKEQLIESIVVMTSGMFHLNQERKEEVGKLNSKIEDLNEHIDELKKKLDIVSDMGLVS